MAFQDKVAVAQAIGANPNLVADLIERHVEQPKQEALEALLVPPASNEEAARLLRDVLRKLELLKRPEDTAPIRAAIEDALNGGA